MDETTWERFDRTAPVLLAAAAALVGVAIALDGAAAKVVNGVAGMLWIGIAVVMAWRIRRTGDGSRLLGVAFVIALVLVLIAQPSDLLLAATGFFLGAVLLAVVAGVRRWQEVAILPALWLPAHLLTAGIRAAELAIRDLPAHVRTDPPPTAAAVPLAMVAAACLGGIAVAKWRERTTTAEQRFMRSSR